ncbi:MAG: fluoride efflux transporter CrcB [Leptolyngbya sp. SIO4C1]|nr:fluoride efflux transporter CrcB [Leptolyngbya sp. SIO4C1]
MLIPLSLRAPVAVGLGAAGGALSRYYLTLWFAQRLGTAFPYGTAFINLSGCLMMGFFATLFTEKMTALSPDIKLLITTGFLGAYTTFSTYSLETINLLIYRTTPWAGLYWLGSATLGVLSIQLGMYSAHWLIR